MRAPLGQDSLVGSWGNCEHTPARLLLGHRAFRLRPRRPHPAPEKAIPALREGLKSGLFRR